jgi:hypothetical protein
MLTELQGVISDTYDIAYDFYRRIDWSDQEASIQVLKGAVASMIATLIVLYIVPLNICFLFGGLGVFIANTAIFKAASTTLTPVLIEELSHRIDAYRVATKKPRQGEFQLVKVILVENQRWVNVLCG